MSDENTPSKPTQRVIHADCLEAMRAMDADSIDAIVCDPPYELSNDGKASAYRVLAELVFPQKSQVKSKLSGEDDLPFLVREILALRDVGVFPRPPSAVPIRPVALNHKTADGYEDVEHASESAVLPPQPEGRNNAEPDSTKDLGCFLLEATDLASFFKALDCVGAGFLSGAVGIGFAVDSASVPSLSACCATVVVADADVGARNNALADLIRALLGAASIPVARFHLGRGASEEIHANGALVFCLTLLLGGAKAVRASLGTGGLPSMMEARHLRVVNPETNRALSFDLIVHPQSISSFGFMGKGWDGSKIAYDVGLWTEALRVAKPGAHIVAFGGTRTFHRLACAIEDAGWEIRDCLSWLYGSGFPKSLDVSKAIDKAAGAERKVVGANPNHRAVSGVNYAGTYAGGNTGAPDITAPATPEAAAWSGWGTALKPAWEPIILARKPLVGTVATNVLTHGTGAINVDGCRIEGKLGGNPDRFARTDGGSFNQFSTHPPVVRDSGRWPANVVLGCACDGDAHDDDCAAAMLDAQTGTLTSGSLMPHHKRGEQVNAYGKSNGASPSRNFGGDSGGASRFFYTAKASRSERGEGNTHPTVKPIALMRWLVKLVCPPGGTILDPFAGSGTTLIAARSEGFDAVGVEREAEYVEIIRRRLEEATPEWLREIELEGQEDESTSKTEPEPTSLDDLLGFNDD